MWVYIEVSFLWLFAGCFTHPHICQPRSEPLMPSWRFTLSWSCSVVPSSHRIPETLRLEKKDWKRPLRLSDPPHPTVPSATSLPGHLHGSGTPLGVTPSLPAQPELLPDCSFREVFPAIHPSLLFLLCSQASPVAVQGFWPLPAAGQIIPSTANLPSNQIGNKMPGVNGGLEAERFHVFCSCNFPLCFKGNDFTKNSQRKKIKFKTSGNEPSFQRWKSIIA